MIGKEAVRAFEEVIVLYLPSVRTVCIVPCNVHGVPLIVLHLNIVPHMSRVVLGIEIAENADTWDIQPVADKLEGF